MDGAQAGMMMHELMIRLGYNKFYIHGGGLGGVVAEYIAATYPEYIFILTLILIIENNVRFPFP